MKLKSLVFCGLLIAAVAGCAKTDDESKMRQVRQNLTSAQARVLGFEAPSSDWSSNNGSAIGSATTVTQGSAALSVTPNGHTQISSTSIAAVGSAADFATFDMQVPANLSWGTVELVFKAPSQGMWWTQLGSASLTGASGGYKTFSFPLSADVKSVLEGTANDISFVFVLNGPSGAQYLIDNLKVGGDSGGPVEDLPPIPKAFSLTVPQGSAASDLLISATQRVTIDDGSTLSRPGQMPTVASVGPETTEFGGTVTAYTNIISHGDVDFVRSQAHVFGDVTTAGAIDIQDASVQIDGIQTENASVVSTATEWQVLWPAEATTDIYLDPDQENVNIDPGGYDSLRVGSRSTVTLRTGEYFFNSVEFEPESHFKIEAANGPVRIYVQDKLVLRTSLEYESGRRGHVLFGYLGTEPALFEQHLVATVIAPNSAIELRRPGTGYPHGGSFFGKSVHVFSNATVLHVPFPFDFLCKAGDADKDGTFDCWDECTADATKVAMGVCGCNVPETDTDGDRVPDCIDGADEDPNNTYTGQCGEVGVNAAPAGTECTDGVVEGRLECDGNGTCGAPYIEAPEDGCELRTYGRRAYWICDGEDDQGSTATYDEAVARCAAVPGRALVRIDHRVENYFIAALVNGPTRIGAIDIANEGEWSWANPTGVEAVQFWTGGSEGSSYRGMYNSWAGRAPENAEDKDCATIDATGKWVPDSCSQPRSYICEGTFASARNPDDNYRDKILVGNPLEPNSPDCVPLPVDLDEAEAQALHCDAVCSDPNNDEEDCRDACEGAASPPPPGQNCSDLESAFINLDYFQPQACGDDSDCPTISTDFGSVAGVCGRGVECLELTSGREPVSCDDDGDCSEGRCNLDKGYCTDESLAEACDSRDGEACVGHCYAVIGCGVNPPVYGGDFDDEDCGEVEYCVDAEVDGFDPNNDLTEPSEFDPAALDDSIEEPAPSFSDDFENPDSCGAECQACADSPEECAREDRHPWCNYEATSPGADDSNASDDRKGIRGKDSSSLKVTFDPEATLKFDVKPLPFGLSRFEALASAAASSTVEFNLLGLGGSVDLFDLRGELSASICRIHTTNSRAELLGIDFLPKLAEGSGALFDTDGIVDSDDFSSQKCEKAIADYVDAVDRAKKAMRDAQELITQYKALIPEVPDPEAPIDPDAVEEQARTFAEGFCEDLLGDEDKRPPSMKGACDTDQNPADTINAFVDYYAHEANQIDKIKNKIFDEVLSSDVLSKLLGELNGGEIGDTLSSAARGYSYYIPFGEGVNESSDTTIVSIQFFIGPIPCLLQVGASVNYGIGGGFGIDLNPASLLAGEGPLVRAGAVVTPGVGSAVTLFAGAGFSAGPFELSLGIRAELSLVDVTLPATVMAGLNVNSQPDQRLELPESVESLAKPELKTLYPLNGERLKYNFSFAYDYGVDLELSNILAGSLHGQLKVKFVFFSLKYSKQLVAFQGLKPINFNLIGGGSFTHGDPDGENVTGQHEQDVVSEEQQPWKASFESVPFIELAHVDPPPVDAIADAVFNTSRVGEVLYNNQCGCTPMGQSCTRNADCCLDGQGDSAGIVCFDNPEPGSETGAFCSTCRKGELVDRPVDVPNPVYESCNDDADCCVEDARCIYGKIPVNCRMETTECSPGENCDISISTWKCDEVYPSPFTKTCHPPLEDPWDITR